jgi:hypothetical protein
MQDKENNENNQKNQNNQKKQTQTQTQKTWFLMEKTQGGTCGMDWLVLCSESKSDCLRKWLANGKRDDWYLLEM